MCVLWLKYGYWMRLIDVVKDDWWFDIMWFVILYLVIVCKSKVFEIFIEVFDYVILFEFVMYKYVDVNFFLKCDVVGGFCF